MANVTPTASDERTLADIESALTPNRAFAAAGGHESASLFPTLRLLVIICLDARVDPAHILGLELGDALVIRNNGGRVTDPAATVASDVAVLRSAAAISPRISFSGHVYDIVTRRVETVISAAEAAQHRTHAPAAC